jgi:hypothetical protein
MNSSWSASSEFEFRHAALGLHPFAETEASRRLKLSFSVGRTASEIRFSFVLSGGRPVDVANLVLPGRSADGVVRRRDELWKSTCFEVFVGPVDDHSYLELNLCPSGDWNVYAFDAYRSGMRPAGDARAPSVAFEASSSGDHLIWTSTMAATGALAGEVGEMLASPALVLSATAVLEYQSGEREYWALVHAGEKPDFHLRESFRVAL